VKATVVAALLALFVAASAAAVVQPIGAAFLLNACTPPASAVCRQEMPVVAGTTSDGFFAAWQGGSATDARGISGRRFQGAAASAAAIRISTAVAPEQYDTAIAVDKAGNFLVAWAESVIGNSDILLRRYRAAGTALAAPVRVSVDPATGGKPVDVRPAVAPTKDGGFVVVWLTLRPPAPGEFDTAPQVLLRRYRSNGTPAAAPQQLTIASDLVSDVTPGVCVDSNGVINVMWSIVDHTRPFEANRTGLALRRLSSTGAPLGAAQVIVPATANSLDGAISCGAGGAFVVAWHTDQAPAVNVRDVVIQRFNNQGKKVGAASRVNTTTVGEQRNPAIAHDSKGNFVVAWEERSPSNTNGIFVRRFNAAGAALSPQLEVAREVNQRPVEARVAHTNAAGNFVVVWQSGDRLALGRRYKP
jgi:hypothetical protein